MESFLLLLNNSQDYKLSSIKNLDAFQTTKKYIYLYADDSSSISSFHSR